MNIIDILPWFSFMLLLLVFPVAALGYKNNKFIHL